MDPIRRIRYLVARARGHARLPLTDSDVDPHFRTPSRLGHEKVRTADGEREVLEEVARRLRPGDVICDAGANFGLYAVSLGLRLVGRGTVFAFEPVTGWFALLLKNIVLNDLDNVEPFRLALGESPGTREFTVRNLPGSGMASGQPGYDARIPEDERGTTTVRVATLDQLVRSNAITAPDVLKIDVEGAEQLVLRGAHETLKWGTCRLVLVEIHLGIGEKRERKILKALGKFGFELERRWKRDDEVHVLAAR